MKIAWRWFWVVLLTSLPLPAGAAYRDLVVMVRGFDADNQPQELGAGFIVDETPQRTVIVTARHVLRTRADQPASRFEVEFSPLRGKVFAATTTGYYADPRLDLAVLFVERTSPSEPPRVISAESKDVISPSPAQLLVGAEVQVIGAAGGRRWNTGVDRDPVVSAGPDELVVRSNEARAGSSGGALFDRYGRLIGMVREAVPNGTLIAVPTASILRQLDRWGLPIGIGLAGAGTSAAELLEQLKSEVHIEVRMNPPSSLPGNVSHTVRARIEPALAKLQPTIEISYAPFVPSNVKKIVLTAPGYEVTLNETLLVMPAQWFATLPDRRRLGPILVTLDFETAAVAWLQSQGAAGQDALQYVRMARDVEASNTRIQAERVAEIHRRYEESKEEARLEEQPKRLQRLRGSFRDWGLRCRFESAAWRCDYPAFADIAVREKPLAWLKLGTRPDSLTLDVPLLDIEEFRPYVASQAEKMLSDGNETIYVAVQLVTGDVLGPKLICHASKRRRESDRRYCTNEP